MYEEWFSAEERKSEWSSRGRHVCKIEDEYAAKESTINEEMDRIIINLGEDSSENTEAETNDGEESDDLPGINILWNFKFNIENNFVFFPNLYLRFLISA